VWRWRKVGEVASTSPDDEPASLQPRERIVLVHDRLQTRDGQPALGDLERLPALDAAEIHAEVLAQLADPDALHDAQNVAPACEDKQWVLATVRSGRIVAVAWWKLADEIVVVLLGGAITRYARCRGRRRAVLSPLSYAWTSSCRFAIPTMRPSSRGSRERALVLTREPLAEIE
jgi:hypothetical protein